MKSTHLSRQPRNDEPCDLVYVPAFHMASGNNHPPVENAGDRIIGEVTVYIRGQFAACDGPIDDQGAPRAAFGLQDVAYLGAERAGPRPSRQ